MATTRRQALRKQEGDLRRRLGQEYLFLIANLENQERHALTLDDENTIRTKLRRARSAALDMKG